jgi:hypothetical protein
MLVGLVNSLYIRCNFRHGEIENRWTVKSKCAHMLIN